MKNGYNKYLFWLFLFALFVFFALYFGFVPGFSLSGLGIEYMMLGEVSGNQLLFNENILFPSGVYINEGYGIVILGQVLNMFIHDPVISLTGSCCLLFLLSYISLIYFGLKLTNNYFLTILLVLLFYFDPFIYTNRDILVVMMGTIMSSITLMIDIKIKNQKITESKKRFCWIIVYFAARLIVTSISWYTAIINAVFSCCYLLVCSIYDMYKSKKYLAIIKNYIVYTILPWFFAMVIILLLMPQGTTSLGTYDLDFFNGNSVSIATLLLPEGHQFISKYVCTPHDFLNNGYVLSGDMTMVGNYLGYGMIFATIIGLIICKNKKKEKKALIIVLVIGLVLSLGPGLKWLGQIPQELEGTYNGYIYSLDNCIKLPWSSLYLYFPLNMMRAVYRWVLIPKLALLILTMMCLTELLGKGRKYKIITVVLGFVMVIEFIPYNGGGTLIEHNMNNYKNVREVEKELVEPLKEVIDKDDLIAVCSYGDGDNGYILSHLFSELSVNSYAGCGDKSIQLNKEYVPYDIQGLQIASDVKSLVRYIDLCEEKKLCDGIFMPYFQIRWQSYFWPWDENDLKYAELVKSVCSNLENVGSIYKMNYGVYIKFDNHENNRLDSYVHVKDKDNLYIQNWHVNTNEKNIVETLSISEENSLYLCICAENGEKNNGKVILTEYDNNGNVIFSDVVWDQFTKDYKLYETEFLLDKNVSSVELNISGDVNIRHLQIEPYVENDTITFTDSNSLKIDEKTLESDICNINLPLGSKMIGFSFDLYDSEFYSNSDKYNYISKMKAWNDDMSFDVLKDGDYMIIAVTGDGKNNVNFYIDSSFVDMSKKNNYKLILEENILVLYVNGKKVDNKDFNKDSIFYSNTSIQKENERAKIDNFNILIKR